ncbi:hypothetical protein N658DRAFT_496824 [Parathielavia hyrcaniae]|uniref:Uncharacterized protein n=1 Tax=Parathielavia hyrcaniae TaxID=113614 RepID=A0AAN6T1T4_9PEZI|nr:hypothetical protein N658DRAFT_496824 [Parathielavia hyrcaniae]
MAPRQKPERSETPAISDQPPPYEASIHHYPNTVNANSAPSPTGPTRPTTVIANPPASPKRMDASPRNSSTLSADSNAPLDPQTGWQQQPNFQYCSPPPMHRHPDRGARSSSRAPWKNGDDMEGQAGCCFSTRGGCCFSDRGGCCCSDRGGCFFSDRGGCCFADKGGCCCS